MHSIALQILKKLTLNPTLRYSELRPERVENNLFTYHLKNLVRDGYVRSSDKLYSLTPLASSLVDTWSLRSFTARMRPKIVTVVACFDDKGKVLLYKRKREPFYNLVCLPYGKLHIGERVLQAASRELYETTGLMSDTMCHHSDVYVTVIQDSVTVTHMLCHLFTCHSPQGVFSPHLRHGEAFWENIECISQHSLVPGFDALITLAQQKATTPLTEIVAINGITTRL